MFNPTTFENSRPDGHPVVEIVGEQPEEPGAAPRRFVPLRRTELTGEVTGPLAALQLTQVFGYTREQCNRVVEAAYRFPLPGDAAVTAVRVRFGEVEIAAELREREQAEAEYREAKEQGRQAALATRESPDVFTLRLAGLQPDQDVTVETAYVQLCRPEGGGWSLRIPLTTSPRYVREDEAGSRHAEGQPLALLRDPRHRFALDLHVAGAASVRSATHAVQTTESEGAARVRLADGEVLPDRDCVLTWSPAREERRPGLQVTLHHDEASGRAYFLALVTPPAETAPAEVAPREVILLVDHSGSMEGPKWAAADWAVKQFLAGLTERDTFALCLFHSDTRWFARKPRKADRQAVEEAVRFLEEHRDSGGTELGVALEQALGRDRTAGEAARHVLVITDAEVSDSGRILRLADEESRRPDRRRISVLCIDAAPNSFLAGELAARGGGSAHFLTSSPEEEDITTALDEVLEEWSAPVLAGLRLEVDRTGARASGRESLEAGETGWTALDLGDLPSGRPLWAVGQAPLGEGQDLSFRLATPGRKLTACRIPLSTAAARPQFKALYGARQVLGLEFLMSAGYSGEELRAALARLGYDPEEGTAAGARKLYAENAREDAAKAVRSLLVREALEYGLASSETAFVAVRREAGKRVEETVVVANALPAGWSDRFLGAAGGPVLACYAAPAPMAPALSFSLNRASSLRRKVRDIALHLMGDPADPADLQEPPVQDIGRTTLTSAPGGAADEQRDRTSAVLFSGVPDFAGAEAVLFDSAAAGNPAWLQAGATFTELRLRSDGVVLPPADPGLVLLLYVGDLSQPRARVRLADLIRAGGRRPLNVGTRPGDAVRLVLADPAGAWPHSMPALTLTLAW